MNEQRLLCRYDCDIVAINPFSVQYQILSKDVLEDISISCLLMAMNIKLESDDLIYKGRLSVDILNQFQSNIKVLKFSFIYETEIHKNIIQTSDINKNISNISLINYCMYQD